MCNDDVGPIYDFDFVIYFPLVEQCIRPTVVVCCLRPIFRMFVFPYNHVVFLWFSFHDRFNLFLACKVRGVERIGD